MTAATQTFGERAERYRSAVAIAASTASSHERTHLLYIALDELFRAARADFGADLDEEAVLIRWRTRAAGLMAGGWTAGALPRQRTGSSREHLLEP